MNLVTRDYEGHPVMFNDVGWINATERANRLGRRVDKWLKSKETQDYIAALCQMTDTPKMGYVKTSKATLATGGGTWLHPKLAVPFARWLDPKFAIWCDTQIDGLIRNKDDWRKLRHISTSTSKVMDQTLQEVRRAAGKDTQSHHHVNEHRLINSLLTGEYEDLNRNTLPISQLDFLAHFEIRNTTMIRAGLSYEERKEALKAEALAWRQAHAIPYPVIAAPRKLGLSQMDLFNDGVAQ